MRTCLGTSGPTFSLRKKFPPWNTTIRQIDPKPKQRQSPIPGTTIFVKPRAPPLPSLQEARKIRSHSVDEFGPFPTMLRFFKEFTELTGRRLRQWHQVGPLCRLLHSLPPVRHYYSLRLIARHWFFPRYDARLLALAGGRAVPIFCCMCTHILLMTINISL